jgi:pilus assembly protein CpaD
MKFNLTLPLLALVLAGCAQSGTLANRTVESVKVPVIERSLLSYDLPVDGRNALPPSQARVLAEYLASIGITYGDRIAVDDRLGAGAPQRRAVIAEVVARHGLMLDYAAPVSSRPLTPRTVRVLVTRAKAVVPGCPDWSRPSEIEVEGAASSNFGCATRSNLAEMIADPNDLVVGKAYDGADARTVERAARAYSTGGAASPAERCLLGFQGAFILGSSIAALESQQAAFRRAGRARAVRRLRL